MTGPEPTEFDLGCFFHGFEGDITPDKQPYRMCVECGHIYWTEGQLLTEFNSEGLKSYANASAAQLSFTSLGRWVKCVDVSEVFYCAWCIHDF